MTKNRVSDQEFLQIVQQSYSLANVIKKCGLVPAGGNYRTAKDRIKRLGIGTRHFTGQAYSKGKELPKRRTAILEYLSNNKSIGTHHLKQKLIKNGIFEHICYACKNSLWNNVPIPLELHHIDGNQKNNLLPNLTLLCPNCHAQTKNYRGKNK